MDDVNRSAAPGSQAERPAGVVSADALKAFAHPLRMAMLDRLLERGPATATQLAQALDESTGQTSYHLRQLHRHGFVEDDPAHSGGRERWWRAVPFSIDGAALREEPGGADAIAAAKRWAVAERVRVLSRWAELTDPDPQWVDVGTSSRATGELTPTEAEELSQALETVLLEHLRAAKARRSAEEAGGGRRVRVYIDVLPLPVGDAREEPTDG
ncbi:MAG TPA: helix-turn-helix domain-containing protein [Propionicimonas sp.]|jgi:DNA-binding transcriptional ArsR family regulator